MAFLLLVIATPVVIYSFCTRKRRRGIVANWIALALSILALLLSVELWTELLTGRFPNGDPVNFHDPDYQPQKVIAGLEALVLLAVISRAGAYKVNRAS